jgi:hypothetical protein
MPPLEGPSAALFRHRARGARSRSAVGVSRQTYSTPVAAQGTLDGLEPLYWEGLGESRA